MLDEYRFHLEENKKLNKLTVESYISDIDLFFKENNLPISKESLLSLDESFILNYLLSLKNQAYSYNTINRKMSSLKSFFQYMAYKGYKNPDPTFNINFTLKPRVRQLEKEKNINIEELLTLPFKKSKDFIAYRDNLILFFIYYYKIDIQELIEIERKDLNLDLGFFEFKNEVFKISSNIVKELETYLRILEKNSFESEYLFLNYKGEQLSRQSVWTIVKSYGKDLGLDLNPQKLKALSVKGE